MIFAAATKHARACLSTVAVADAELESTNVSRQRKRSNFKFIASQAAIDTSRKNA